MFTKLFTTMKVNPLLIFILLVLSTSSGYAGENIRITNAWISEAPPTAKALAGYMEIHNSSDKPVFLRSITSDWFEQSEFHKTEIHEGMARMTPVPRITIKPDSKVVFEPGGLHLMLINPGRAIKAGNTVPMTLHFTNNNTLAFKAKVKKMSAMKNHEGHNMSHDIKMDEHGDHHEMHDNREDIKHDHKPHKH